MATIATRLTNTGTLLVNGTIDEQTDNLVYDSTLKLYLNASKTASYSGSGTSWVDQSGNSNNATLISSPTFTTSGGGAITFNPSGTGQYANVPIAAIPSGGSQISVCCWVNLGNPATPPAASVFSCYDSSGNRIVNIHLPWSDSVVYWDAGNSGGTYNRINTGTLTTAQKTGWHHWAFTLNATAGTMAIYLDGVSIATGTGKTLTLGTVSTATYPCAIASFTGTANWNGSLSSFEIYNVALTATQVAQNYAATSAPTTKFKTTSNSVYATEFDEYTINGGSVARRDISTGVLQVKNIFDEFTGAPVVDGNLKVWLDAGQTTSYPGTGTTWTDLSGNGNTGTLVGSPTFSGTNGGGAITTSTSAYISTAYNIPSNTFTISMFTALAPSTYWATVWANESYSAGKGYLVYLISASSMVVGTPTGSRSIVVSSYSTVNHWAWVVNGTTMTTYKNGVQVDSGTFTAPSGGLSTTGLYFGARHTNPGTGYTDVMPLTLYNAMVYDRVLTADEIAQNFNALRRRYNI